MAAPSPLSLCLAFASLGLGFGCRGSGSVAEGSPGAPDEGRSALGEAVAGPAAPRSDHAADYQRGESGGSSGALIAVVALDESQSGPCEQFCGPLGDCLGETHQPGVSSGFELECLDLCVHSPAESTARERVLACDRSSCGALVDCARGQWPALTKGRISPGRTTIDAEPQICDGACRWMYSCLYTGNPPGDVPQENYTEEAVRACVQECQAGETAYGGGLAYEEFAKMYTCLQDNCGGDLSPCFGG